MTRSQLSRSESRHVVRTGCRSSRQAQVFRGRIRGCALPPRYQGTLRRLPGSRHRARFAMMRRSRRLESVKCPALGPFSSMGSRYVHADREARRSVAELGFVGLGVMGGGIARRLLDAGHTVYGYNRTPEKAAALVELGLVLRRAAARGGRARVGRVLDGHRHEGGRAVTDGPDGILAGLGPGSSTSTCRPRRRRTAARLRPTSRRSAPACWTPPSRARSRRSRQGKLVDHGRRQPRAFAEVEPILLDIGPVVTVSARTARPCCSRSR